MIVQLVRRPLEAASVLIGVSMVVFLLLHLSGDPAALLLPPEASQQEYLQLRHQLGFDDPLPVQYGRFLVNAMHGDFGQSVRSQEPALNLVLQRLPATATLATAALAFALVIAFPAGIVAALNWQRLQDQAVMVIALFGQSMPVFWLGVMGILLFSVYLRWLPTGGSGDMRHLVLPAVTLGLFSAARTARLVRSGMLEVLAEDYIRTARAKGLPRRIVVVRHALKNALVPVVTVIGLDLAMLLGGAVLTETVFGWPGVGRLVVEAIQQRDYPVVQASVFVIASIYVAINMMVDVLYKVLDPRVRYS